MGEKYQCSCTGPGPAMAQSSSSTWLMYGLHAMMAGGWRSYMYSDVQSIPEIELRRQSERISSVLRCTGVKV